MIIKPELFHSIGSSSIYMGLLRFAALLENPIARLVDYCILLVHTWMQVHVYRRYVEVVCWEGSSVLLNIILKMNGGIFLWLGTGLWVFGNRWWVFKMIFSYCIQYRVHDSRLVRFWTDIWCEQSSFSAQFPLLFSIAGNKSSYVYDNYDCRNGKVVPLLEEQ